jgi:hypothetical protein
MFLRTIPATQPLKYPCEPPGLHVLKRSLAAFCVQKSVIEDRSCKPEAKGPEAGAAGRKRQSFQHSPQADSHERQPSKSCHNANQYRFHFLP